MTTQNQSWSETTIGSWANRWSVWLAVGAFMAGILFVTRENFSTVLLALILTPVCVALMTAIHCLSREILSLRKKVEDLEKKNNS